jgi:beta-lactamase superfamily II metal-dependent hydrolase
LLYDAGPNGSAQGVILPYLSSRNITSLDYIVTSHYHADHIGGVSGVYSQTGATNGVWDRGWSYSSQTYTTYSSAIWNNRYTLTQFQEIDLGDGVMATVMALNGNGVLDPPYNVSGDENDYSVVLLIEAGAFSFFIGGDLPGGGLGSRNIETSVANVLVSLGKADVDVYRVNHHGSNSSSWTYFLNTLAPETAIISCGADNPYGHPHEGPVTRMDQRNIQMYMTTIGGSSFTLPEDLTVVGDNIIIETSGYDFYTVDGDIWELPSDVSSTEDFPSAFALLGNYPNPFNPATVITFTSAQGGPGQITVFDLSGSRHWQTSFTAPPGTYQITWQARDQMGRMLPAGVYLYQVIMPDGRDSGKMVLTK